MIVYGLKGHGVRNKIKKSIRRQSASRVIKSELDFMLTNSSAFT